MEGRVSAVTTPANTHRTRRKSYGRSCMENPSMFWQTPGNINTLGRRGPTSRRVARSQNIASKVDTEQLALLVKHEWKLAYVTPLYRFQYTQLKLYSKHLTAFIVAEKQQGVAVEVGLEAGFKVSLSTVHGMAETEDDAETVFIQIHSKPMFGTDTLKPVWRGWLTCVNGDCEYLRSLPPDFVSLPLFCSSGPESLTALVKSWFERTFDCNFGALFLNSTTLNWLAALWTGCHPSSNIRYLKLSWTMPTQPSLDILYTVNPQDAWELWDSIHTDDSTDDRIHVDEVQRFMNGLETHFFRHFKIYLSAGTLTKVSTSHGSAHHEGKIKIGSSDYISTLLTLLTECALRRTPV
ncbi:centromere protein L isoform X1 [Tachysurus fulvidraco]|uniref:centromere protein L isoform X1 n=1 Tax=Tachysurus fulvidraco TaxID=1234273 RepID=UPI000F4F580F|nr:centromere protein L isoform X1 [Tachysurus fulvidraco]